ncbi:MAG: RdgB/HAM1 family non-canonical purine NTP pyrophosphatase [Saprospiraceae bacterium]|nr:RdgB/HAM1 family non-canonical purine NTP pyrophosphatase [Saprospiraceae bacterium]
MEKLVMATGNAHKAAEVAQLLDGILEIQTLKDIGCTTDIPETGNTFEANAMQKAVYVFENFNKDCFADDSGLVVDALDGAPGIYSARFAGEPKSDAANNEKLLQLLANESNRKAKFVCVIALIFKGEKHLFEGEVQGTIRNSLSGREGFGYDPLFQPDGYAITFAEMDPAEKNAISHRGRAVAKLIEFLKDELK